MVDRRSKKISCCKPYESGKTCKDCKYVGWEYDEAEDKTVYACLLSYGKIRKTLKACGLFEAKDETV